MPANYVLLEKITVGAAGASSVTFSGIPQTGYTDLVVKLSLRSDRTADTDSVNMTVNGSSTSMTWRYLLGNNSVASSATAQRFYTDSDYNTASTFGNAEVYIPNYASANYKSFSIDTVSENNATSGAQTELLTQLWSNTAAITSITFAPQFGTNWKQYSTFYLYGVAKLGTTPAIQPYATGGDTIMTDGTYWYHTFLSSGTFTPAKALSVDYLVVAGGGGGAGVNGGGGAGGLRSTVTATGGGGSLESALALASGTGYTVTIGAGGTGGAYLSGNGNDGSNSVFSTITSTGGGGGGGYGNPNGQAGRTGGSGGGGGFAQANNSGAASGGTGTSNQGYAGGSSSNGDGSTGSASGGGGGAGAVGGNGTKLGASGNGGAGVATSISGSSVTYAGGGGGGSESSTRGTGGAGGGGNGYGGGLANSAGTANTGGGGGGGRNGSANGANGGSGIVIVRYAV